MDRLKAKLKDKSETLRGELKDLIKKHRDLKVDDVKVSQIFGGMRGIKSMLWETSHLDPIEGIRFRGHTIPELRNKLPKFPGGNEPKPEGLFWLMLVDEIPTEEDVEWLSKEWDQRSDIPDHTFAVLNQLSADTHPMTQFSIAISSLQSNSVFARRYSEGMNKLDFWDATYEDTMDLIAALPRIAAYIYRKTYHGGDHIEPDHSLDWAGNYAYMLGFKENKEFQDFMRLYLTIHADHEGGNASAHTVHLVGSTLSDAYLAFASGMNSLAGPLHGLANQEVIKWIVEMTEELGTTSPSKEQIKDYVNKTLSEGKVIPGYGHAVLRQPDPRFVAQKVFAEANISDSDMVNNVWKIFEVVPPILESLGKVKNPWPNVDAHSGAILSHYGLSEYSYYTVLFGVSRALGVLSALCWSRALGLPLERPKSVTSKWLIDYINENS